MASSSAAFFDYTCQGCGQSVCERQSLMNLALGYEEHLYCVPCLAQEEALPLPVLLVQVKAYIASRECFRKPWQRVAAHQCPRLSSGHCPCQDDETSQEQLP